MRLALRAAPLGAALIGMGVFSAAPAHAADVAVCIAVRTKDWSGTEAEPEVRVTPDKPAPPASKSEAWKLYARDAPAEPPPERPKGLVESQYLARLIEYEVTHEVGFAAVKSGCSQRLAVELYPLHDGWTVFARYSGNQREEKVDYAGGDELGVLAQRLTKALLRDVPVTDTITRRSVLRADTEQRLRKVGVQGHLLFGLGTALRYGALPSASDQGSPSEEGRFFTPAALSIGYRGKFRQYGLDAFARANLGLSEHAPNANAVGGHVDYAGGLSLGLHFLYYFDPDGLTSLYAGGGASFEVTMLTMIRPEDQREDRDRDPLLTGGLNADVLVGYEFMRASAIHFFGQLEVNAPTYGVHSERRWGVVDTYLPGAMAQIGVIF